MKSQFQTRDLLVNIVGHGRGVGTAGLFINTPPTPLTPITPIASLTAYVGELEMANERVLNVFQGGQDRELVGELDQLAQRVGRAVLVSGAVAQCTMEMPTCAANQQISMIAHEVVGTLQRADIDVLRRHVVDAARGLEKAQRQIEREVIPDIRHEIMGMSPEGE